MDRIFKIDRFMFESRLSLLFPASEASIHNPSLHTRKIAWTTLRGPLTSDADAASELERHWGIRYRNWPREYRYQIALLFGLGEALPDSIKNVLYEDHENGRAIHPLAVTIVRPRSNPKHPESESRQQSGFPPPVSGKITHDFRVAYRQGYKNRVLFSKRIDYKEIEIWLTECTRTHNECIGSLHNAVPGLLVIDCMTWKVVPWSTTEGEAYVALSYVWGSVSNRHQFSKKLRVCDVPRTVRNSIKVVHRLGLRYLWVDQFCIDQSNQTEKHHMISNMDAIYANAAFTIVAAAGSNADYGLPGVSTTWRKVQNSSLGFRGTTDAAYSLHSPKTEVDESSWSTRGWTYQEGILSRRRLIFTTSQVAFQCSRMCCAEWGGRLPHAYRPIPQNINQPTDIFAHLDEFVLRHLRYEEDTIKAFLGIFRAYERLSEPVYHIWGVPLLYEPSENSARIVRSLLWASMGTLHRQRRFPSWSWAGWTGWVNQGPYHWSSSGFLMYNFPTNNITIGMLCGGKLLDCGEYLQQRSSLGLQMPEPERILYLTCWTTEIRLSMEWETGTYFLEEPEELDGSPGLGAVRTVFQADERPNRQFARRLRSELWTVAVISWDPLYLPSDRTRSLVLDSQLERSGEGAYSRIGILESLWALAELDLDETDQNVGSLGKAGRSFSRRTITLV